MATVEYGADTVQRPDATRSHTVPTPFSHGAPPAADGPMTGMILVRMPSKMERNIRNRAAAAGQTPAEWARRRLARAVRHRLPRGKGRLPKPDHETEQLGNVEARVSDVTLILCGFLALMDEDGRFPDRKGTRSAKFFRSTIQNELVPYLEDMDAVLLKILGSRR